MSNDETSGQESSGTDLEITVCENGVVNVHRPNSDRAHSVFLDEAGAVVRCTCKGHRFHDHCYHGETVENRPLVVSAASAAAASTRRVAADGGRVETSAGGDEDGDNATESGSGGENGTGTVEVSGCAACDGYTTGGDEFCSDECREAGHINETPL